MHFHARAKCIRHMQTWVLTAPCAFKRRICACMTQACRRHYWLENTNMSTRPWFKYKPCCSQPLANMCRHDSEQAASISGCKHYISKRPCFTRGPQCSQHLFVHSKANMRRHRQSMLPALLPGNTDIFPQSPALHAGLGAHSTQRIQRRICAAMTRSMPPGLTHTHTHTHIPSSCYTCRSRCSQHIGICGGTCCQLRWLQT